MRLPLSRALEGASSNEIAIDDTAKLKFKNKEEEKK
jgi:hypothetical protein